jgi:hypothetical protein
VVVVAAAEEEDSVVARTVCYQDVPIQEGLHAVAVGVFITMQYSRGGGP